MELLYRSPLYLDRETEKERERERENVFLLNAYSF